mgnify:CR=1 FL=1
MEINALQLVLIFIIACVAGMGSVLDEFQTHRPLIACTLIGLVLGDLKTGIIIGGTLEMMALGWMNIGAAMAPDAALASIISTIIVIAGKQDVSAGIAIAIPIAAAGQVLTILARTITVFFQHQADRFAKEGNLTGIDMCHIGALLIQALRVSIPAVIVGMFVGTDVVQSMLGAIPEVVTGGLRVGGGVVVVVGYAMVINMMEAKHLMPFFFLGFVVAAIANLNLVALGVIGTVAAIIYIQLSPKYNKSTVIAGSASNDADDEL